MKTKFLLCTLIAVAMAGAAQSQTSVKLGVLNDRSGVYSDLTGEGSVVAARMAGLRAVDGPVADYRDEEGLRKSCLVARSLGFDGKWCIHPDQVGTVNEVFSSTEKEIEWARKVISAYEEANAAGSGSISVDGQMVDAASIKMAQNTLDLDQKIEAD